MDLALIADYDDEETYARWFDNPEHAKVRTELLAPIVDQRARCQIRI